MKTKLLMLFFLTAILLSACSAGTSAVPTLDVNLIYTSAAETVVAELTQTSAANSPTPEATATAIESAQSATAIPTSASAVETLMPTVTATPIPPTVIVEISPSPILPTPTAASATTATPQACDDAIFVDDISVQDGTEMSPGQDFEKTWLIKNTGTCTWGAGYHLVFGYGEKMSGQARALPTIISPGETVEVTVVFTAPITASEYKSYWRMANTAGANFGEFFSVIIIVR